MKFRLAGVNKSSIVDGKGVRYTVYMQGCKHNCVGCHNPETHSMEGGTVVDTDDIIKELKIKKYTSGITLSGGDPFFQPEAAVELAKEAHKIGKNVWCYTGFTIEEIVDRGTDKQKELLRNIDILVDGRFDINKKSLNDAFKGSSNQRIIDIKATLRGYETEKDKICSRGLDIKLLE